MPRTDEATQVPTTSSLDDIYPAEARTKQKKRWNNLLTKFENEFNGRAAFVARSPGRVNIIGEVGLLAPRHPLTSARR